MNKQIDMAPLVRELRGRLQITQEKFAARLGVTFPTINRWENGKAHPSPLAVQQVKDLLHKMGKLSGELYEQMAEGVALDTAIRKNLEALGYGE